MTEDWKVKLVEYLNSDAFRGIMPEDVEEAVDGLAKDMLKFIEENNITLKEVILEIQMLLRENKIATK